MSDIQNDAGDTKASGESTKPNAWTPAEKNILLLRLLNYALQDGNVDWKQIQMPGRTTKALKNQWTVIRQEMKALTLDGGDENEEKAATPSPDKPKKTTAPRKRGPKKAAAARDGEAGENAEANEAREPGVSTPVKPSRGRKRQSDAVGDAEGSAKKKRTPKKATTKVKAKKQVEEEEPNDSTTGTEDEAKEEKTGKEPAKAENTADEAATTNGQAKADDDSAEEDDI